MGLGNPLVVFALAAFPLFVAGSFFRLSPRHAVIVSLLGGWLFLPHFDGRLGFLGIHTKAMFVPACVLLGSFVFDLRRWPLRPLALDVPMIVLCIGRFVTALANDQGIKEGIAATLDVALEWGAPYLLGRCYLGPPRALKELATALVTAALIYVPFCLWEIRMSPGLHRAIFGFQPWGFDQAMRFGGYRPAVFMQHGLAVGMFMTMGTLIAFWLWRSGGRERILRVPLVWTFVLLLATTLLCKSTGAIILLGGGMAVLESTRHLRSSALIIALALAPSAYCTARLAGWNAEAVVAMVNERIDPDRASSMQARISNEVLMIRRANKRPWLGWGRMGGSFAFTRDGRLATPDSLWILVLGYAGLMGLAAIGAVLALPPLRLVRKYEACYWRHPELAPAAALAVGLLLWAMDNLFNDMMSPLFPLVAGALVTFLAAAARQSRTRPQTSAPEMTERSSFA